MQKPIIVVRNKKYAMEAQKRQKQWNLGEPDLSGEKKKQKLCDIYQFPGCEFPLWKTASYQKLTSLNVEWERNRYVFLQ